MKIKKIKTNKGALLFELLIVISLIALVVSFSASAIYLSMRSNKATGDKDTATSLATEALEAARSVADEDWQNIYSLTKGVGHYYPSISSNKWILTSGDEIINLNNVSYTRYITIDNVSRHATTRDIEVNYVGANDDPSTQKVTVFVSFTGGDTVSISEYFSRWKNKICGQAGWVTGGSGNTVQNCTDTTYDVKDIEIDVTGGALELK